MESESVLSYLKQIAEAVGLETDKGNTLADDYSSLSFIPEHSVLSYSLNQKQPEKDQFLSATEFLTSARTVPCMVSTTPSFDSEIFRLLLQPYNRLQSIFSLMTAIPFDVHITNHTLSVSVF